MIREAGNVRVLDFDGSGDILACYGHGPNTGLLDTVFFLQVDPAEIGTVQHGLVGKTVDELGATVLMRFSEPGSVDGLIHILAQIRTALIATQPQRIIH